MDESDRDQSPFPIFLAGVLAVPTWIGAGVCLVLMMYDVIASPPATRAAVVEGVLAAVLLAAPLPAYYLARAQTRKSEAGRDQSV